MANVQRTFSNVLSLWQKMHQTHGSISLEMEQVAERFFKRSVAVLSQAKFSAECSKNIETKQFLANKIGFTI